MNDVPALEITNFSGVLRLFSVTMGLPPVINANSKAPEALQIKLLSDSMYIQYLEAPDKEKAELLEMIKSQLMNLELGLNQAKDLLEVERNKLTTPLSLDKT